MRNLVRWDDSKEDGWLVGESCAMIGFWQSCDKLVVCRYYLYSRALGYFRPGENWKCFYRIPVLPLSVSVRNQIYCSAASYPSGL